VRLERDDGSDPARLNPTSVRDKILQGDAVVQTVAELQVTPCHFERHGFGFDTSKFHSSPYS
jgi:hypothetical protein